MEKRLFREKKKKNRPKKGMVDPCSRQKSMFGTEEGGGGKTKKILLC